MRTLAELVAFALIAERRAHERYAADARTMEETGNAALAGVFRRLAEEENKHAAELEDYIANNDIEVDLGSAARRFDSLGPAGDRDRPLPDAANPYAILARAVANEERAFEFYCQIAASATDPQMRAYAKAFAEEELAHAALLRAQRREAYRQQRALSTDELPDPEQITSRQDLLQIALVLERRLAAQVEVGPLADACQELIAALAAELEPNRRGAGSEPASHDADAATTRAAPGDELDRLFSFYDRVVQTTKIESVARTAQSLIAATLDRIHTANRRQST